jgi:hypothetical protein
MKDDTATDDTIEIDREKPTQPTAPPASVPATVKAAAPTAPPGHQLVNPFARYGELEGSSSFFNGDLLKLDQKLGYVRGREKTPLDTAQGYVTNMMEAYHGYVKFASQGSDERTEYDVRLISEQPDLWLCKSCGRSVREHDDKPKFCSWKPAVYLPLRSLADADDVVCFTGTGKGARKEVAELCKIYGRPGADRGGRDFVVMLETYSFRNSEEGTTVWPVFKVIGYEFFVPDTPAPTVQPVVVPIEPPAKAAAGTKRGDMDDEIPF